MNYFKEESYSSPVSFQSPENHCVEETEQRTTQEIVGLIGFSSFYTDTVAAEKWTSLLTAPGEKISIHNAEIYLLLRHFSLGNMKRGEIIDNKRDTQLSLLLILLINDAVDKLITTANAVRIPVTL